LIIGASLKRKEDPRLLTGQGTYVDDIRLPGMLHAVVVRSPYAHAVVRAIDPAGARALPGVALVATATDLGAVGPIPIRLGAQPPLVPFLQHPLARTLVRYVGEPVAIVVAGDRYTAEDAGEILRVDYEELPSVTTAEQAMAPQASILHEAAGSNRAHQFAAVVGEPASTLADALEGAAIRIRQRFSVQRHTGVPLETRGLVASSERAHGTITVWGPTKVPHFNRGVLAELLGHPVERIRFIEPDVGGGFGVRGEFYPEDFLIPWASVRLGRPVKWVEDRREHLMATNHSRQQIHDVEVGATQDGRILALVDHVMIDMGAYLRTHGVTVPELTAAMLPGPYRIPRYRCEVACVVTNKTPTGTYRSPGRFEANFVRERMVDLVARAAGIDPAEIRRRNLIPPEALPYAVGTSALGEPTIYDTGAYASTLTTALNGIGYEGRRAQQRDTPARGCYVGIGMACYVEKSGPGPWEFARVELNGDGRAAVYSGTASVGQGVETVLAQICAQELGLSTDAVQVFHGDTATVPEGIGAWGSRATVVGGSAVLLAARGVKKRLFDRAADRLEASPSDLVVENGRVMVRGAPLRAIAMSELAESGLAESYVYQTTRMTYPYGAHAAVVEVDGETGRIAIVDYAVAYDIGKAVNPALVEGQLIGGLAQGIGGAILEEIVYDAGGQPLSATFMDYLLPTSMEMPRRLVVHILEESPTPLNPLGAKGAGEGGTAGAGAAIANAVADALRPLGVEVTDLPLSPDRIRMLIRKAAGRADDGES